ncbi:MAG: hypothetical protein RIC55_21840 [Pirellulaceae bacterium]
MRRPRGEELDNAPGQDSFLDIVANLVGILIILVMVVGVRAQDALIKGAAEVDDNSAQLDELEAKARAEQQTAESVERNINLELAARLQAEQREVAARRAERDQLLTVITAAEHLLGEKRGELDNVGQASFDLNRQVEQARNQLRVLENSRRVAQNSTAPPAVVEHRPTPMAKTVFGQEICFRLMRGRLAYVPKDELEELFKGDVPRKAYKLRESPVVTETIGPIRGFRLRYTLKMQGYEEDNGFNSVTRQGPVFDHYDLIAESDRIGEPFEVALRPDSLFRRELARVDPQTTTVTVWVYPDSYGQFRQLKDELYQLGFLTASWPMPEGELISAGPNGHRSVVQ